MRLIATLLIGLMLVGCGTVNSTRLDVRTHAADRYEFLDARPAAKKISSKTMGSSGEFTYLGDDSITPSAPLLFKSWLNEKLPSQSSSLTIELHAFDVEILDPTVTINSQGFETAVNSTPGADPLSALLAYAMIFATERIKSDKTVEVRIAGKVGELPFQTSCFGYFSGRVTESNINSVLIEALDTTIAKIEILLKQDAKISENKFN